MSPPDTVYVVWMCSALLCFVHFDTNKNTENIYDQDQNTKQKYPYLKFLFCTFMAEVDQNKKRLRIKT